MSTLLNRTQVMFILWLSQRANHTDFSLTNVKFPLTLPDFPGFPDGWPRWIMSKADYCRTLSLKWIVCLPMPLAAVQLYSPLSVVCDGRTKLTVSSERAPSATFRCQSSSIVDVERRTRSLFFVRTISVGRWTNTRHRTHVGRPVLANTYTSHVIRITQTLYLMM